MRNIDLESMRFFKTVAELGSISQAALQLNRVPSNVSTRIKLLEERLGVALFSRRQGRFTLTPEGEKLVVYADQLLQLATEAELAVTRSALSGIIRLGALESCTAGRLPPFLATFHKHHSDVSLELSMGITSDLITQVQIGKLDAAIVAEPFFPRELNSIPLFVEELVLIAAKRLENIPLTEWIEQENVIVFPEGCSYRKQFESWLTPEVFNQKAKWEVQSYHAIIACVSAGAGCAIVPMSLLASSAYQNEVSCHPIDQPYKRNLTHIVFKQGQLSPELSALLGIFRNA